MINNESEKFDPEKNELKVLAQSWLHSYYMYVKAFNKLMGRYKALKKETEALKKETEALKRELQEARRELESRIMDERLIKFGQQWSNPVKHIRTDITNEEIIELYSRGMKPYQIAKALQEKNGVNVSYRTIISRIKRLREKGVIQ
jgi:predicted  nucleic acid-binding Zn-ribbon protein